MTKLKWGMIGGGEGSQIGPAHRLGAQADGNFILSAGALDVDAAKGKLVTSELQVKVAAEGVQLHGGHGYMAEYPISRQYTDAKISTIYAGSSEVMKIIISRDCLGDDYQPFNTRNF